MIKIALTIKRECGIISQALLMKRMKINATYALELLKQIEEMPKKKIKIKSIPTRELRRMTRL
jgi:hypothetical protein